MPNGLVPNPPIIILNRSPFGSNPDPNWIEARLIIDITYLRVGEVELTIKLSGEPDIKSAVLTSDGKIYLTNDYINQPYSVRYAYLRF